MKYNGITIPETIKTNRIISAFINEIDPNKLEDYSETMKGEMLSHRFPPITGYPSKITEDEIGNYFLTGEEINEDHIGLIAWYVTDGHHRALSAINAKLPYLETKIDYSCLVSEEQIKEYNLTH